MEQFIAPIKFDSKYGYIIPGADTVVPFKKDLLFTSSGVPAGTNVAYLSVTAASPPFGSLGTISISGSILTSYELMSQWSGSITGYGTTMVACHDWFYKLNLNGTSGGISVSVPNSQSVRFFLYYL